jgi:uncharacterized protein
MKKITLLLLVVFAAQFSFSQEDADFKKDVLKVIERSGASGQMAAAKKQILTMIPEDKHAAFLIEFEAFMPKVNDATAKIYMEEYTKEDVKAMLAFYDSPIGKKMAEKAETIASKSQEAMMSLKGDMQALVMKYMN